VLNRSANLLIGSLSFDDTTKRPVNNDHSMRTNIFSKQKKPKKRTVPSLTRHWMVKGFMF
jgi:hypothetical protein